MKDEISTAWQSTTTVRKTFPKKHRNELDQMKIIILIEKKIVIIADKPTDFKQKDVLTIFFLELDCFEQCKPLLAEI